MKKNKSVSKYSMNISEKELKKIYLNKDWNKFFKICNDIIKGIIYSKYPNIIYYVYDMESFIQDCQLEIWKLHVNKKINPEKNIFNYITGRIHFKCRDVIRNENRRINIIPEVDFDSGMMLIDNKGNMFL